MKIGTYAEIAIATKNLYESQAFYQRLGFEIVPRKADLRPHILLSDGVVQIHLYENTFESPALLYRSLTPTHRLAHLKTIGLKYRERTQLGGRGRLVLFGDPSGFQVGVIDGPEEAQGSSLDGASKSKLGQFSSMLIAARSLDESVEFWESVGFVRETVQAGREQEATLSDGLMRITLRQSAQPEPPCLAFFAPNVAGRIDELKTLGVRIQTELASSDDAVENVVIQAPEGTRLLLINSAKAVVSEKVRGAHSRRNG